MPNLGPMEILVILVVALIVFGPKKLPEIGKSIGRGLREFKKASNEVMSTLEANDEDDVPRHTGETMRGSEDTVEDSEPQPAKEITDNATDSSDRTD